MNAEPRTAADMEHLERSPSGAAHAVEIRGKRTHCAVLGGGGKRSGVERLTASYAHETQRHTVSFASHEPLIFSSIADTAREDRKNNNRRKEA